jgi:Acetyltransferase (GNAT) family
MHAAQQPVMTPINLEDIPQEQYGDYTYSAESLETILQEIIPIHQEHWNETEGYRDAVPFSPNYEEGFQRERSGTFILLTVRDKDQRLIGNCMVHLSKSTHTKKWVAEEDTIFILKEHRKGRLGIKFIKYVERVLQGMSVTEIRMTANPINRVSDLFGRMGYEHVANKFTKVLGETYV